MIKVEFKFDKLTRDEQIIAFMWMSDYGLIEPYPPELEDTYHHKDYKMTIEEGGEVRIRKKN